MVESAAGTCLPDLVTIRCSTIRGSLEVNGGAQFKLRVINKLSLEGVTSMDAMPNNISMVFARAAVMELVVLGLLVISNLAFGSKVLGLKSFDGQ
ncbi:hypothetical protein NC651_007673 [Populus alba x Populus x berolinensis]|nr:hypothetical protein NC651_007673 [Populus alba x Populus x berolinensis]